MQEKLSKPIPRTLVALFCTLLWGSAYPMIKLGYQQMNIENIPDKIMFAGMRYVIAGLMVFLFVLLFNREKLKIQKDRIFLVILFGLVQTGFMYFFNYIGVANTTATKSSVLTSLTAFMAVLLAPLFFKNDKITIVKIIGCVLGLVGVIIVNLSFFDASFSMMGEGCIIIATILNTAGGFIGKVAGKGNPFGVTAYQLLIGGAFLLVVALMMGGTFIFSFAGIAITVYLALVSAVAFSLWTMLLIANDASKVIVFNLFIPIFGALWSLIILGEKEILSPLYIISIVLVSLGTLLVNLEIKKKKEQ